VTTAAPPRAPTWTPTPIATATPRAEARIAPQLLTFTIPLAHLGGVDDLRAVPEGRELIAAARRHPDAPIHVRAYVTESDTRAEHADAGSLSDEMVIETARYLAERGIDANRISGKGMGIDEAVGRAVVITIDLGQESPERSSQTSQIT
jgi:hypothetical protein